MKRNATLPGTAGVVGVAFSALSVEPLNETPNAGEQRDGVAELSVLSLLSR